MGVHDEFSTTLTIRKPFNDIDRLKNVATLLAGTLAETKVTI